MTTYGYRYRPGGMVIELHVQVLELAVAAVIARRLHQSRNGNKPTVELVEQDGDEWRAVPLPDEAEASAS